MKNVMVRAWEIAKRAVVKFGGSAREYFAQSLSMAWAESRQPKPAELIISSGSRNFKTWVARITGTHDRFGFKRDFLEEGGSGMGTKWFDLNNGAYEVCAGPDNRYFINVVNGVIQNIEKSEVLSAVANVVKLVAKATTKPVAKVSKSNFCYKCHSYCWGDCEAN